VHTQIPFLQCKRKSNVSVPLKKPHPVPTRIWNTYCGPHISCIFGVCESPTVPMASNRPPAKRKYMGGILIFPIMMAPITAPIGTMMLKGINRVPAMNAESPLTVWKCCGIWIVHTVMSVPTKNVFLTPSQNV
jgi:hypothetical protein